MLYVIRCVILLKVIYLTLEVYLAKVLFHILRVRKFLDKRGYKATIICLLMK